MQPAVVFIFHDPEGMTSPHLNTILSDLKTVFSRAYVGVTPLTHQSLPDHLRAAASDGFFTLITTPAEASVGQQFLHLYRQAAAAAHPSQILHLCFIDRLAFILQSSHRRQFIEDVAAVRITDTPLIFSRSPAAWASHPRNYHQIERFITTTGELLFGRRLDFSWCHLAICASRLEEIAMQVGNNDLSVLAEMTLALWDYVAMRDVDWLEWEDPFLLGCSREELKCRRERSKMETHKRLSYVIPMLQLLEKHMKSTSDELC